MKLKENDNVFYFTTCGWMMWNWLVTALASKASIVLFEGFPMYKRDDLLIKLADEEKITLFGVSAKYIDALNKSNILNKKKYKLKNLRTICSTGSPLSEDGFKFIYKKLNQMYILPQYLEELILFHVLYLEIFMNQLLQDKFKIKV